MDSNLVSVIGITKFMLIIFIAGIGLSRQGHLKSLSDASSKVTLSEDILHNTTSILTSKPQLTISETVCTIFMNDYILSNKIIYGGEDAKPGSIPHMGAIGWRSKHDSQWVFKCGGSLISANFLVTAAHCSWLSLRSHCDVVNNEPEIVRLGVEDITEEIPTPTDKKIKRIIKHPDYKSPKKYFDIALIELEDEVTFTINLHPACLWTRPGLFCNDCPLEISGWGLTEDGQPSSDLQVAFVDNISTELCDELLMKFHIRHWHGCADHQMCAGKLSGKVDTCQGDSGGPIQQKIPFANLYFIMGVTSFGVGCGKEKQPSVYTRIYSFTDWIEEIVWKDEYKNKS